jgi:hypothetical protein
MIHQITCGERHRRHIRNSNIIPSGSGRLGFPVPSATTLITQMSVITMRLMVWFRAYLGRRGVIRLDAAIPARRNMTIM